MANKKKKRLKRQLKKQFRQSDKQSIQVLLSKDYLPAWKEPIVYNIDENYEEQKKLYEVQLNEKYAGTITAKERFINYHSTLIHVCSECAKEFYARPEWLLTDTQPHECYFHKPPKNKPKVKRKVSDEDIELMKQLYGQGLSMTKIANEVGVSRPTVIKYLREAGLC